MISKKEILYQAKKLFNEKGYSHVTMRDISDSLGISVGNLTYHYAKKQDILQAIMTETLSGLLLPEIKDLYSLDLFMDNLIGTLETERFYFSEYVEMRQFHPDSDQNIAKLIQRFHAGLNFLREQGLFHETFTPAVQKSLVDMMFLAHLAWICEPERKKSEFIQSHWILFYSYLSEKGKREYEEEIAPTIKMKNEG